MPLFAHSTTLHLPCLQHRRTPPARPSPQVTLIDQSERFVFKPLLYELISGAASDEEVAPHFSQLLGPYAVTFVQGRVASVQPEHATQVSCSGQAGLGNPTPLLQPACAPARAAQLHGRLPGAAAGAGGCLAEPHTSPPCRAGRRQRRRRRGHVV